MALIVYNDIIIPECLLNTSISGRMIRMNERGQNQGGFDFINQIWQNTLRQ